MLAAVASQRTTADFAPKPEEPSSSSNGDDGGGILSLLSCTQRRPKSAANNIAAAPRLQPIVPKKPPAGFAVNSPVAQHLMYDDAPEPGLPAPTSPAPFLAQRFAQQSVSTLRTAHEGKPVPLYGGAAEHAAGEHLSDGWTQDNLAKFRQNELLCQQLFGQNWDPRCARLARRSYIFFLRIACIHARIYSAPPTSMHLHAHAAWLSLQHARAITCVHAAYQRRVASAHIPPPRSASLFSPSPEPTGTLADGRSRVRDAKTGALLCWGDGDIYSNAEVAEPTSDRPTGGTMDGAELRTALRQDSARIRGGGGVAVGDGAGASPLPPKATKGRRLMVGHPAGEVVSRHGDGYYRWLDKTNNVDGVIM